MVRIAVTYGAQWRSKVPAYSEAVRRSGAEPVELCADDQFDIWDYDGVLLTGGTDVNPAEYRAEPHPLTQANDPRRDRFEIELAHNAMEDGLPLLAICRGIQVLNVACGGTLLQHVEGHSLKFSGPEEHEVGTVADSRLRAIYGERNQVNSRHHQALGDLGHGLAITARSPDGLIEGVEITDSRFIVGVQWHPEDRVAGHAGDRALFEAFIRAATER